MLSIQKELAACNGPVWKEGTVIKTSPLLHEAVLARDRLFSKLLEPTLQLVAQAAWRGPACDMYGMGRCWPVALRIHLTLGAQTTGSRGWSSKALEILPWIGGFSLPSCESWTELATSPLGN